MVELELYEIDKERFEKIYEFVKENEHLPECNVKDALNTFVLSGNILFRIVDNKKMINQFHSKKLKRWKNKE